MVLPECNERLPAGDYVVETDEELLQSLSFPAYRRIATYLQLPVKPGSSRVARTLKIDPCELDKILSRNAAPLELPAEAHSA